MIAMLHNPVRSRKFHGSCSSKCQNLTSCVYNGLQVSLEISSSFFRIQQEQEQASSYMHSTFKVTRPRLIASTLKTAKTPRHTRKMSFFPHSVFAPATSSQASFTPLFRLLEDYDNYSQGRSSPAPHGQGHHHHGHKQHLKSFTPKFDVAETENAYELHGELPGIEQKDVDIEFVDSQTLTIKGRIEREYTSGTPPSIEGQDANASGALTDGTEQKETPKESPKESSKEAPKKVTVEDEPESDTTGASGATDSQALTKSSEQEQQQVAESTKQEPQARYWVSERSIGTFARTFTFPERVNHDGVTASMKNGVLTIAVPKAPRYQARKIQIQ
jgi:HSP20 family protein